MKKIKFEQILLIIIAVVYLLESYLLAGLFTNPLLLIVTLAVGLIALIISLIKKQYKWAIIDLLICLVCSAVAAYLYSL